MNGTRTALEHAEIPESDWALAGIPENVNATGLLADDLEEDYGGLTEIQTLIIACVATVIPLFLGLLLILGVRMVWKKYKNHNTNNGYDNDGLHREDSCDAVKSSSFMQSAEELKTSESQYSVLMPDDVAACCYAANASPLPPLQYNSPPNNRFGDTNKTNLNGSIITLTMKNNHLIVETEERVPGNYVAESSAADTTVDGAEYEYDDDEFDMEAEMLRREFREASLLANGGGGGDGSCGPATAVLEPSSQTQVDLTMDRRPTAAAEPQPPESHKLQLATADHSSGGSSSVDSRVAEMAYAYGNQSEYRAEDNAIKHCTKGVCGSSGQPTMAKSMASAAGKNNNNNNNNDDEYLVEQRLLGNGADGRDSNGTDTVVAVIETPATTDVDNNYCSPEDRIAAIIAAAQ